MVSSDKGHGAIELSMMWWYDGHVVGEFSVLRGHKGAKKGDMCHHSQGDMW